MSIDKKDRDKINYRPDMEWFKERMYKTASGEEQLYKQYMPSDDKIDGKVLYNKFQDLKKKAQKLDEALDALSMALKIPVDKEKQPRVSYALEIIDPSSKGEYVSYSLYKDLLAQTESGTKNVDLEWILNNETADKYSNSDLIYYRYALGAQEASTTENVFSPNEGLKEQADYYGSEMLRATRMWGEHEFYTKQILDFTHSFLAKTNDILYIPWNFKPDLRRKLIEYDDIGMFLSQYTDFAVDLSESVELMPNTPLQLARDLWDSLNFKGDSDNNFFNRINDILGFNYTSDLICCFASWAHGLDLKTLEALKILLTIVANGISFDYGALLNTLMSIINYFFRNVILSQLVRIIDQIFQMITNPIRNWLNTDDEKWKRIFLCTPIDELINTYILGGLDYLEKWLIEKIIDWFKMIEIDMFFEECKVTLLGKSKELGILAGILDMVIETLGKLAYCGLENSPIRDRVSRFLESYNVGPNWNYEYPIEENPNEYNSFTREVITLEETVSEETGKKSILEKTELVFINEIKTEQIATDEAMIDQCLKRVAEDDVFSVQEWMEDIRAKATEGS